jgi:ABC-type glycerol-3-phosphate transport system substrate-binding protein
MRDTAQSKVAGKYAVSPMPAAGGGVGHSTASLGGGQLAINAYSDSPDAAYKLIEYLTEPAQMLERAQQLIDGSLVAELAEVKSALRLMAERNRIIAEGAGACPVACALAGKAGTGKVVCIVSGGNIDLVKLCEILTE